MPCHGLSIKSFPHLSSCKQAFIRSLRKIFVIRLGFEPKTHSLEGCCSIQLSYRTILSWTSVLLSGLIHSEFLRMAQPHKTSCTDTAHAICGCKGSAFSRAHQIFRQIFFLTPQKLCQSLANTQKGRPLTVSLMGYFYPINASASTLRSSIVLALTVDSTVTIGSMMVMFFIASRASRIFLPDAGAQVPFSTKATLRFW